MSSGSVSRGSTSRRTWRATLAWLIFSLVWFVVLAEGAVRVFPIPPRVQVVQLEGEYVPSGPLGQPVDAEERALVTMYSEVTDQGVPLFYPGYVRARWRLGCAEGEVATRVAAFGSSILAGNVSVYDDQGDKIWSEVLQRRLSERGPACVSNLAAAGYSFDNQWAMAERHLASLKPDIVYWEMWTNSPQRWQVYGDRAYRMGGLAPALGELPNPFRVPYALHESLFRVSRLWEGVTLASATQVSPTPEHASWRTFGPTRLGPALELTRSIGAELVLLLAPPLHRPFEAQIADRQADPERDPYRFVASWAEANGVDMIRLDERLRAHDVEAIRLDTCCHYNAAGQALIADILEQDIATRRGAGGVEGQDE